MAKNDKVDDKADEKAEKDVQDEQAAQVKSELHAEDVAVGRAAPSVVAPAAGQSGKGTVTCTCYSSRPIAPGELVKRWGYAWRAGADGYLLEAEIPKAAVDGGLAAGRWIKKGSKSEDAGIVYWREQHVQVLGRAADPELTADQIRTVLSAEVRRRTPAPDRTSLRS
jgi:hypothetical protein